MDINDFAPNLSFFFSNGVDPEYAVIGRVARRIWAKAMREKYNANERSQMLKEAKETKDRIVNEAKDQAKAEAAKIIADAQAAIQTQKMAALTDVKNQIGNMVIEVAEKVIRKQLDNKAEQEKYIQQMAGELHQFGN
jgi:F0F1-type ATP synthase membrane subunit b/b'